MLSVTGSSNEIMLKYVDRMTSIVDWTTFLNVYRKFLNEEQNMSKALRSQFYESCKTREKARFGMMSQADFASFLRVEQKEEPPLNLAHYMSPYVQRYTSVRASRTDPKFSFEDFLDYLFSPSNSISGKNEASSNMNRPLPEYFINSSHNTYLSGHQFKSESNPRCYARVLRLGVRCIEIDCWDGNSEDSPIAVTHGNTLCSRIDFTTVVRTVRDHAFVKNPYPVVISIEDHCSLPQQKIMAEILSEELRGFLLISPIDDGSNLPSPEDLKYKILLKHKKFNEEEIQLSMTEEGEVFLMEKEGSSWIRGVGALRDKTFSILDELTNAVVLESYNLDSAKLDVSFQNVPLPSKSKVPVNCLKVTTTDSKTFFLATEEKRDVWEVWASSFMSISSAKKDRNSAYASHKRNSSLSNKKKFKFAQELLDLIVYCRTTSVPEDPLSLPLQEMLSFSETKARSYMIEENRAKILHFHKNRLSRVYPKGFRMDSSNFHPILSNFWGVGSQMCSLNFQTPCEEVQINQAWFSQNGSCGYVLKPRFMLENAFDPINSVMIPEESAEITISILCGRHLVKNKPLTTVHILIEIIGCSVTDRIYGTTRVIANNSFNPVWDETFKFGIVHAPSLAVLRFGVFNEKQKLMGQATVALSAIRRGYRSVGLKTTLGELSDNLSSLLVHVKKQYVVKYDKEYVAELCKKAKKLIQQRDEATEKEKTEVLDADIDNVKAQLGQFFNRKAFSSSSELPYESPLRRRVRSVPFIINIDRK